MVICETMPINRQEKFRQIISGVAAINDILFLSRVYTRGNDRIGEAPTTVHTHLT